NGPAGSVPSRIPRLPRFLYSPAVNENTLQTDNNRIGSDDHQTPDDGRKNRPAYKQLAAELRDALVGGKYGPGTRLPTEAELVAAHGVSRQTVRQAFSELVTEGLIYRVRGRGTFAIPARPSGAYLRSVG